ncbi:citryl-CoA lyase [Rhodanobacter thiooxydans]|uniref:Citryl-CoA lyase n=1 Tax=Rhodanobacter thiooxydans TaxID=416169 RepID=A0A154QGR2_9GAMM|nr:CoA ester lyase [Rhodanobacter thiooxydans]EIM03329.1 citryL-CoA lyase [Rhodanobacter thiooxydans LCS2]KZC23356.1 citryl-CoA lyase [Rhodanobacter thiooxydans]MCW0201538.1 CoA ester lyase [Rhodanobacter thiooxydans]
MRSKLFVPGSRPELFAKALTGDADALSFDLEDAVAEARKAEARAMVADFVAGTAVAQAAKLIIVRTNAPDSPHFAADLAAVARPGVTLLNLPKIESPQAVLDAVAALEAAERANAVAHPIGLLLNIETPRALADAARIAAAHPRVAGLQLGLGDLFEPHGIDRADPRNVHAAMFALRMAAAQAGVFAVDGAYAALDDDAGYREEARMARRLGFIGKSCVHPRQVALANAAFAPSEAELETARRIVEAAQAAGAQSRGAFVVDGRMIDPPFLKRAQALLAAARRPG